MCFREVNIEEIYIGIFFILLVKVLLRQENYSSKQYRQQWTQLSYILPDNINHGHWKSRRDIDCPSVKIWWLLNRLTCLQLKVLGKFDLSPCGFWAVQIHLLANFLFVLLVNLNPVLLYCCARTMTYKESFKKKAAYLFIFLWKLNMFCMWNISCVKFILTVLFSILISTQYIQHIQTDISGW